jgi:hypothetical protein
METFTSTGTTTSTAAGLWVNPPALGTTVSAFGLGTTSPSSTVSFSNAINFTQSTSKQIMQNKVAVFQIVRDEDDKIIKTEFIKELWVETKNGQSVDFQVARDKDLADYEMSDLSIRTIYTVTF